MPGFTISSPATGLDIDSGFSNPNNAIDGNPDTYALCIAPTNGILAFNGFSGTIPNNVKVTKINFYTTYFLVGASGTSVDVQLSYKSLSPQVNLYITGYPTFILPNADIDLTTKTTFNYNLTTNQINKFIEYLGNDLSNINNFVLSLGPTNNMPNTRVYEAGINITYKTPTLVNVNNAKVSPQVNIGTIVSNIIDFGNSRSYSPNSDSIKILKPTEKYFFPQGRIQNAASSAPFSTDGAGSVILSKNNTIAPTFEVNNSYYENENHPQFFLENSNDETGYSYEFWIKPNSFNLAFSYLLYLRGYYISYASTVEEPNTGHFLSIGFNTSGQLVLTRDYAGFGSDVGDTQDFDGVLDYTFNTNEWYHIVLSTFIRDIQGNPNGLTDGRCNLYINGIPIVEPSGDISSVSPSVENEYEGLCFDYRFFQAIQAVLGQQTNGVSNDKFDGKISYFALHDKRFTAEEVKHNYNSLKPRYIN